MAALVSAGLPTDRFLFAGFLPAKRGARRQRLAELKDVPATLVLFEGPSRVAAMLADMAFTLGNRPAAVARELTKKFEEVRRGSLPELAAHYAEAGPPRGEVVLIVGPPDEPAISMEDAELRLAELLATESVSKAAALAAAETGLPRRALYQRALALSRDES